jgi:hypothetical protein
LDTQEDIKRFDPNTKYPKFSKGCLELDLICTATTITEISTGKVGAKKLVGFEGRVEAHLKESDHHLGMELAALCLKKIYSGVTLADISWIEDEVLRIASTSGLNVPSGINS